MILKSGIPILLFLFSVHASPDKVAEKGLAGLRDVRYRHFLEMSRSIFYSSSSSSSSSRTKRSAIFSTGVKVCPQETAKAVISSHRAYYKLRVCQESIWEAFRIFFDRVPNSEEYMAWVHRCQHENLCMDDLARNFSSSAEHLDMVARRVAELGDSEGVLAETPEPGKDCPWTSQNNIVPTEPSVILEEANVIPEKLQQYIVEFSVTVEDPIYNEILQDPSTPEYADVVRELRDKMYHVFAKIPGFKEIQVLGFRAEDVSVRYAVTFNGDTELSDQPEGYHMTDVETQKDVNAPKLQNIIVKALKQEHSLPLDLNTLSFDAVYAVEDHMSKIARTVAPPVEESSTAAMGPSHHVEDSIMSTESVTYTVMPFNPEVLTDIVWIEPEPTPAHPAVDAVILVEHITITTEEREQLFTESPMTDHGAVIHLFSDATTSQIIETQATVPTSLDLTVQILEEVYTTMETSATAEEDQASRGSSEQSVPSGEEGTLPAPSPETTRREGDSTYTEEESVTSENTRTEEDSVTAESTRTEEDSVTAESTRTEEDSVTAESTRTEEDSVTSESASTEEETETSESASTEEEIVTSESTSTEEDSTHTEEENVSSESTHTEEESVTSENTHTEEESTHTEEESVTSENTHTEEESTHTEESVTSESTHTEEDSTHTEEDSTHIEEESTHTEEESVTSENTHTEEESVTSESTHTEESVTSESTHTEEESVTSESTHTEEESVTSESTSTEEESVTSESTESTHTEEESVTSESTHTEEESVTSESTHTEEESVTSESTESTHTEEESVTSESTHTEQESTHTEEESGGGLPSDTGLYEWTPPPAMMQVSTPLMAAVQRSKDLVVFFRLRVSNMMFTEDLFNKDSLEYKSLENTFLELLLPYLETNLTGFKALEILSFQNGSVIVNSKMKLNKAVPYNVTEAVHCVLEDFCQSAANQLDIQVDSRSLEVEPADEPDPCRSVTCSEFSRCMINGWSGEAECVCEPGYSAVEGQPCQSLCTLQPDFCLNGGLCQNIPGHGATCRCPVGKHWHYHGERCDELITLPLDNSLILTGLVGSLCLVGAVIGILIFINKKCINPQKAVVRTLAPYAFDHTLQVNPAFQHEDEFITQVSTLPYPSSSVSSQSQASEQEHFVSIENIHLSIEIPRQLYTTRSEKLISDKVDFHHCIPHSQTWRPQNPGRTCCLLRASENDCLEVTVV